MHFLRLFTNDNGYPGGKAVKIVLRSTVYKNYLGNITFSLKGKAVKIVLWSTIYEIILER